MAILTCRQIEECRVNFLSLSRALRLVPPEFKDAYDWFERTRGERFPRLPIGNDAPAGLRIKLARQAGIFSPNYTQLPSRGDGKKKYVLSIHTGNALYDDKDVIDKLDGTWILDYCAHRRGEGRGETTQAFNENMMNNLRDGVPVGVLIKGRNGYENHGLAFVERYNPSTDSFVLHGPVTAQTEAAGFYSFLDVQGLGKDQIDALEELDEGDSRRRVLAEQIRRENQQQFRQMVLDAYDSTCVVTDTDVPQVLQAAHIDPYRGKRSQKVTNGLLLRADLHLLYDAHLMTVEPESHVLVLSPRLRTSGYGRLEGRRINDPVSSSYSPDDRLLEMHYREFLALGA